MWFYLRGWLDGEAEAGAWDVFLSGSAEGVFLGMFMAAARRVASFWKMGAQTVPPPGWQCLEAVSYTHLTLPTN